MKPKLSAINAIEPSGAGGQLRSGIEPMHPVTWRREMKTIIIKIAFATSLFAIAGLTATGPASAAQRHQAASKYHPQLQSRSVSMPTGAWGGGYDRASSPFAGGGGA
jgi:hypothetical protein